MFEGADEIVNAQTAGVDFLLGCAFTPPRVICLGCQIKYLSFRISLPPLQTYSLLTDVEKLYLMNHIKCFARVEH